MTTKHKECPDCRRQRNTYSKVFHSSILEEVEGYKVQFCSECQWNNVKYVAEKAIAKQVKIILDHLGEEDEAISN